MQSREGRSMSESDRSFIDLALNGEVLSDEIDDFVDAWHESDSDLELYAFLGMTEEEYSLWMTNPAYLDLILSARHRRQPIAKAVNDNYLAGQRIAARADQPARIALLKNWVEAHR